MSKAEVPLWMTQVAEAFPPSDNDQLDGCSVELDRTAPFFSVIDEQGAYMTLDFPERHETADRTIAQLLVKHGIVKSAQRIFSFNPADPDSFEISENVQYDVRYVPGGEDGPFGQSLAPSDLKRWWLHDEISGIRINNCTQQGEQ